ncbi:hypothetical protein [Thermoproteus tenax]|uniref:Uncharacterized protein n=1 Tax=Thermoproteus tenax (strain ATCC 35583 / DSM 2078 / JCM 9277 / NBRC 100435 / Kra 1) TaxID=768679 RepID=G4RKJ4_THETK|nr:hypothetical protein [Thermoproteus tenax]CCC82089.1 hypothetical protein TTX_1460 [Thermoproteus tenax Kra 1]
MSLDFNKANELLYKGYLYQLILAIVAIIAIFAAAIAAATAVIASSGVLPPSYPYGSSSSGLASIIGALVGIIIVAIIFIVIGLIIFFKYIFKGYIGLHKLGVKWAFWLAWGPIIELILAIVAVALFFAFISSIASALGPGLAESPFSIFAAAVPVLAVVVVLLAFSVFIDVAKILFLKNMYDITKIGEFNIAFVLTIVALALSLASYTGGLLGVAAGIVELIEYIFEMLAYRGASRMHPPPLPAQPQSP